MSFVVINEVKVMVILLPVYIPILGEYVVAYCLCVNSAITILFLDGADMNIIHQDI